MLLEMPTSDHKFPELQDVVGLFSYAIRVRSVLANDMTLVDFIARTRMSVLRAQGVGFTYLEQTDTGDVPITDFHIAYRKFPGDAQWELFGLEVKPVDLIERIESGGLHWVGEKTCKIVLRVDKEEANEVVNIIGSGLIFSHASFDEFNNRFALTLHGLSRVSDLSITIDNLLRSGELSEGTDCTNPVFPDSPDLRDAANRQAAVTR